MVRRFMGDARKKALTTETQRKAHREEKRVAKPTDGGPWAACARAVSMCKGMRM
jgi:hypothetical protein